MPDEIRRERVVELLQDRAQLIEVLSAKQYEEIHLAGAVNIPLKELDADRTARLDLGRPAIPYCYDYQ